MTGAAITPAPDIRELSINGMTPFLSGADIRDEAIRGAHGLLVLLSAAFDDATELYHHKFKPGHEESIVESCNSKIKADALHGVSTLLALAQFGTDLAFAENDRRAGAPV